MDEFVVSIVKGVATQGPYAALLLGALLYLNSKLTKSEKAREELNDLLLEQNKEHLAAAVKTAEALMGLKSIIERLMDRVPPAAIEHRRHDR